MTTPRITVPVDEQVIKRLQEEADHPGLGDSVMVFGPDLRALLRAYRSLSAAPAPEGGVVDWDAKDQELIERGLRTIRTHDAVRYLREALTATTVRLTGYDWNADPDGVTKQQGDAFAAADRVFADLGAAVASHPEIELPECQTCGGTGKIEEAARMECANKHSACIRTCDDCDGCGFAPDDEPAALATREEAPAEAGESLHPHAQPFEQYPELALHIERMAMSGVVGSMISWDAFLRELNAALRAQPPAREDAQPVAMIDGEAVALPSIAVDGPHWPCEHRLWLARQLLDSRMSDAEAYSTIAFSPAITDLHPAPDALRVAAEALEVIRDSRTKVVKVADARAVASEALAALQAEQKGGA